MQEEKVEVLVLVLGVEKAEAAWFLASRGASWRLYRAGPKGTSGNFAISHHCDDRGRTAAGSFK